MAGLHGRSFWVRNQAPRMLVRTGTTADFRVNASPCRRSPEELAARHKFRRVGGRKASRARSRHEVLRIRRVAIDVDIYPACALGRPGTIRMTQKGGLAGHAGQRDPRRGQLDRAPDLVG